LEPGAARRPDTQESHSEGRLFDPSINSTNPENIVPEDKAKLMRLT